MIKKYGLFLSLFLVALMIMWLPFLPVKSNHEVDAPSYTTIVFKSSWGGVDAKSETLTALIDQFNKSNPDIRVIDASLAGQDFLYSLKTDIAANDPPDVFGLWPGSDLETLIDQRKIANLSGLIKKQPRLRDIFHQKVSEAYLSDEDIYSIPFEVICEGLFINGELFDRYSVPIPTDNASLIEAVKIFKSHDVIPIALNMTPEGSFMIQNLTATFGGKAIETDQTVLLDSLKKSLNLQQQLYAMGAFPEDCLTLDDHSRNQLFLKGKAAMIFQGSWFYTQATQSLEDVAVVYPPGLTASHKRLVFGLGNGNFHMSQNAYQDPKRRDAAWRFLLFLTSEGSAEAFSRHPGFMSSLLSSKNAKTNSSVKQLTDLIDGATEHIKPADHLINRQIWEDVFIAQIPLVMTQKMTVEEALFKTDEALRALEESMRDAMEDTP